MALTWQKSTKVVLNCQDSRLDPVFSRQGLTQRPSLTLESSYPDFSKKSGYFGP